MSRLILIPIAIVLLLVVIAAVSIPLLLDEEKVLELASDALYRETGATLTVAGEKQLSIYPTLGVSLQDAAVTMPQEPEPSLRVRTLDIGVQLVPLLKGSLEIDTISLDGLSARIESAEEETPSVDTSQLSDEQLDAFYAKRRKAMEEAGQAADTPAADQAVPPPLKVQRLIITDSRLELVDPASADSTVIELVKLEAIGLNLDADPIPVEMQVRLPAEQVIELELFANLKIDQAAQLMTLEALDVLVTGATAEPLELQTRGTVDLSRQVADLQLTLELGATKGEGTLRYASFESPMIDTRLKLNLFDPALLALAGPAAAEAGEETAPSSGDEPLPLDAIRLIDTRAVLNIEQAVFDVHRINNMQIKLRAVDGVIRVPELTGDLHGGKLDMKAVFDGKHNTASLNATGGLDALDIATALSAMESSPLLTGTASLDWKLASKGRTANELVAALRGPISLTTNQMVLREMGVQKMLCQAVALVNQQRLTAQFPTDSNFEALGAELKLGDGKVNLSPLQAELAGVTLTGTGALDLLSQDFKTVFKARLSPELEELDPACQVSKRLTAIDWPVECKGNISEEPAKWCGVETGDIIADLARNEAQKQVKKEAGKLMDKLFKK